MLPGSHLLIVAQSFLLLLLVELMAQRIMQSFVSKVRQKLQVNLLRLIVVRMVIGHVHLLQICHQSTYLPDVLLANLQVYMTVPSAPRLSTIIDLYINTNGALFAEPSVP